MKVQLPIRENHLIVQWILRSSSMQNALLSMSSSHYRVKKARMKECQSIIYVYLTLHQNAIITLHNIPPIAHSLRQLPFLQPLPSGFHLPLYPLLNRVLLKFMLIQTHILPTLPLHLQALPQHFEETRQQDTRLMI